MTEDELDRETARLFAAARREKPAGALRERVMRGVSRGERARATARRITAFSWAAVAAGVGGLVWSAAMREAAAPNVAVEPERASAHHPVPETPSAHPLPSAAAAVTAPPASAAPSAGAAAPVPSASAKPRRSPTAPSATAPSGAAPSVAPPALGAEPPTPEPSKALDTRE